MEGKFFLNTIEEFDNKIAYFTDKDNFVTYRQLVSESDSFGISLLARQLALCISSNSPEFLTGYLGMMRQGIVPILLNSDISDENISALIQIYKPRYVFSSSDVSNLEFKQLSKLGNYKLFQNQENFSKLDQDLAILLTTSGTTSSSKLVKISYNNIQSNTKSIVEFMKLDWRSRAITTLPFNYSYGLSIINTHLFVGGSLILNNHSITEPNFWEKFRNCSPTHLGGVPFSYEIYKRFEGEIFSSHSVDTLTQAGGRLSEKLVHFFAEKCLAESKNFYVMYGQTEATARISFLPAERAVSKPGSIGRAIPGGQIFLHDSTNEIINVPHTAGELVYIGPNVSLGYAESFKDLLSNEERQELLHTGDIGFFDSDGDFFITGRSSRYAKINAVRINLEEIDSFLAELGFISATITNDVKIFVFLENRHPFDELKVKIQYLANIRPSQLEVSRIDLLPRTNSGKINFRELDNWI